MSRLARLSNVIFVLFRHYGRRLLAAMFTLAVLMMLTLAGGKIYQHIDRHPDRGAMALSDSAFGDHYTTPMYLDQGWGRADSLWFYNTTQGSNLLPYAMFLALEDADSQEPFVRTENIDRWRYLPQVATIFNPDALPVGFVKDSYRGKDYVGLTCAACHTGQINYRGQALRIDGGPALANMALFMEELERALRENLQSPEKQKRYLDKVVKTGAYESSQQALEQLELWYKIRRQYNIVNHSSVDYGYGRLDAFGRIYNRVLQYVIDSQQLHSHLRTARYANGERMFSAAQVDKMMDGIDQSVVTRDQFMLLIERLMSDAEGMPKLGLKHLLRLRDQVFNEPNAPVSYPFLWDTAHSDYVQWNGIAKNAGAGPLGRNVGEVTGVFASLDWSAEQPWYAPLNIAARVSGQDSKKEIIKFRSSVDLINLQRLENALKNLKSPSWPGADTVLANGQPGPLPAINKKLADKGQALFAEYCQSCHQLIDRNDWDRKVVASMSSLASIGTDPAMAENSVNYVGSSGNFKQTYQKTAVGTVIMPEQAPVAMILSAATAGLVATPDSDKWWIRRQLDWLYLMAASFFDNDIESSVQSGNYQPSTTAEPFRNLLAYKARPLNGIWATAPYLHNGSVPTLYDLLLPVKREGDPENGEYRPDEFMLGSREFDAAKVGFVYSGYQGQKFSTAGRGNLNSGHEYAAGRTPQLNGEVLPALNREQRWALVEYMKTL
ncbi:di-heme-cytochrome C peroxidase [Agaribacterium haliotis]|uniref:di-heme-cytochrome C peroxidase n=1 Tax=Agaribacterium haliotis TaxID=2013869 RepID=UPI000BB54026|nr:di-heme-cytochrome C peroxidase [Agaribacterium haliotis]